MSDMRSDANTVYMPRFYHDRYNENAPCRGDSTLSGFLFLAHHRAQFEDGIVVTEGIEKKLLRGQFLWSAKKEFAKFLGCTLREVDRAKRKAEKLKLITIKRDNPAIITLVFYK